MLKEMLRLAIQIKLLLPKKKAIKIITTKIIQIAVIITARYLKEDDYFNR